MVRHTGVRATRRNNLERNKGDYDVKHTTKEDYEGTRDFYLWIAKQTDFYLWKRDWFLYGRIESLDCSCAFCHEDGSMLCEKCPLKKKLGNCNSQNSVWNKCKFPSSYKETKKAQIKLRQKCALKIAEFTDKFIKENWR